MFFRREAAREILSTLFMFFRREAAEKIFKHFVYVFRAKREKFFKALFKNLSTFTQSLKKSLARAPLIRAGLPREGPVRAAERPRGHQDISKPAEKP